MDDTNDDLSIHFMLNGKKNPLVFLIPYNFSPPAKIYTQDNDNQYTKFTQEILYFKSGVNVYMKIFALELILLITFLFSFELMNGSNITFKEAM